eukprot:gene239-421_t
MVYPFVEYEPEFADALVSVLALTIPSNFWKAVDNDSYWKKYADCDDSVKNSLQLVRCSYSEKWCCKPFHGMLFGLSKENAFQYVAYPDGKFRMEDSTELELCTEGTELVREYAQAFLKALKIGKEKCKNFQDILNNELRVCFDFVLSDQGLGKEVNVTQFSKELAADFMSYLVLEKPVLGDEVSFEERELMKSCVVLEIKKRKLDVFEPRCFETDLTWTEKDLDMELIYYSKYGFGGFAKVVKLLTSGRNKILEIEVTQTLRWWPLKQTPEHVVCVGDKYQLNELLWRNPRGHIFQAGYFCFEGKAKIEEVACHKGSDNHASLGSKRKHELAFEA